MKKEDSQQQNQLDFEPFYEALEEDPKLLDEAIEILLDMVELETNSIKKVALYIKEDSRNLYNEITKLYKLSQNKGNTSSCCGGINN
ncbi:hypothetical protein GCM10011344_17430 [Dokdonia pacifica]|uniref:Uncharacterized protein n=1 Tax=Dokdonia pacifica TaxID=1627892 RepID=A0A238VV81_9FLAO|nr:hypothetical protein [Dokdonia pacifica]GGG17294.1 hypothetical protein GCM10011344_17430 [Dokdonia pacifica]SNR38148.1 hypothetical protein SAMN06265376_101396 [Dokdonia pacifica]